MYLHSMCLNMYVFAFCVPSICVHTHSVCLAYVCASVFCQRHEKRGKRHEKKRGKKGENDMKKKRGKNYSRVRAHEQDIDLSYSPD